MNDIADNNPVIAKIIKQDLKVEASVKSIESLFENDRLVKKTNYTPYYQRNYVWDKQKATYFIESIFIGTEIPPLVFFNDGNSIEVIDGRQRYETIKKFIDVDFSLVKGGLDALSFFSKQNFNDLSPQLKEIFRNTKLRIIEFSIVNSNNLNEHDIDLLKKEIFRRYNSGITPLKKPEIEKAMYIHDDVTSSFKSAFKYDSELYKSAINLLLGIKDSYRVNDVYTIERLMTKIRLLLVVSQIPIKRLSSKGQSLVNKYYSLVIDENTDPDQVIEGFRENLTFLESLKDAVDTYSLSKIDSYLLYETVFWALEVIKDNDFLFKETLDEFNYSDFLEYLAKGAEHFSSDNPMFYRTMNDRYSFVAKYFEEKYNVNFTIYIENGNSNLELRNPDNIPIADIDKLNEEKINKPEPSSETIEDICKKIKRERFLIRPPYQRREVINRRKSANLIESILIGIKIPPIFIFKRSDDVMEVIDGQQRLLSVIGFLGEEFLDEDGELKKSNKNLFKLNNLKILSELNGKSFGDLSEEMQDKIHDFNIPIVTIDQSLNPNFDPIDLFIRLNNKPYPIRDDSFEMWNSYVDRDFISLVKKNVEKHCGWFYLRSPEKNSRMDNEQCYTQLAFLFYKTLSSNVKDQELIKFYKRSNSISSRIKDKSEITRVLETLSNDEAVKKLFFTSIEKVENFIVLIRNILSSGEDDISDEQLKERFGELMNFKSNRRTMQGFYLLWYILNDANTASVKVDMYELKKKINYVVSLTRNLNEDDDFISDDGPQNSDMKNFMDETRKIQSILSNA